MRLTLALVVAVAAWLRLHQLGMQVAVDDEWHSLHAVLNFGYRHIFLHFGGADHCIPLTLFYKLVADTVGLGDWGLRLPSVLAGLATVALVPAWLQSRSRDGELLLYAALLAVSPLLVHFSRFARPYALSTLLAVAALMSIAAWHRTGRRSGAVLYVVTTALAAWFHPLTLPFCGAAGLWVLGVRLVAARRAGFVPVWRALAVGAAAVLLTAALIGPPLWTDWGALAGKAGEHAVSLATVRDAWALFAGTASGWVSLVFLALTATGGVVALRRDAGLTGMMLAAATTLALAVVVLQPAWVSNGQTFARYLLPALPLILWWSALGLAAVVNRLIPSRIACAGLAIALLAAWILAGPLPEQHGRVNSFMGHKAYVFDFDPQTNVYRNLVRPVEVPAVYRRIAESAALDGVPVVEVPWRYVSHHDPFWRFQQVHGNPVRVGMRHGVCVDAPPKGEYARGDARLDLSGSVHLADLLENPGRRMIVAFHTRRHYAVQYPVENLAACVAAFRDRYGEPWLTGGGVTAFLIGPDA